MKIPLIILLTLIFLPTALSLSLEQGQSLDFEGHTITAKFIQETKVVMQVDDERDIINNGQTKTINSVRIEIVDIFYSTDISTVSFNAALTYTCGDGTCNQGETYTNCCQDCECPIGQQCTSSGCISPDCFLDEDCNDHNPLTEDNCDDYRCKHREQNCKEHSECNDNNPDTDDFCHEGKCQNLQNWICKADSDCEHDDPCILGQCINKDCQYKRLENCKSPEKKEEPKKEETLKFTDEEHPGLFTRFFTWLKNLF